MVKLDGWSVVYPDGTRAVDSLSLSIGAGERIALIGANGAGKSSLILSLAGVLGGTGSAAIDGIDLEKENFPAIRRRLGIVFQNPDDQLFCATVYDDVAFGLRNMGLGEDEIRLRVNGTLARLGLGALAGRTALRLSGGEKRMAALATVLAMEPSVLALDEPTAFLDPKARRTLIVLLSALPHTMLIATHDFAFAAEVCRRVVVLKKGRLFADGGMELLYDAKLMDDAGVEAIAARGR